jgi:hypothetical protein
MAKLVPATQAAGFISDRMGILIDGWVPDHQEVDKGEVGHYTLPGPLKIIATMVPAMMQANRNR